MKKPIVVFESFARMILTIAIGKSHVGPRGNHEVLQFLANRV